MRALVQVPPGDGGVGSPLRCLGPRMCSDVLGVDVGALGAADGDPLDADTELQVLAAGAGGVLH